MESIADTILFIYRLLLMLALYIWRDTEMAERDFIGKVTAIIPNSRGLMSSTCCNRLETADKPLQQGAVDFFFSVNNFRHLASYFPVKDLNVAEWQTHNSSEGSWILVNTENWECSYSIPWSGAVASCAHTAEHAVTELVVSIAARII